MSQFDDVLKAYHSGGLSAAQVLEQLKAARPTLSPYPLSEGQRGLWALEKSAAGESGYNLPFAFRVRGPLSVERLHAACEFVWSQHPVLRTVVEEVDGVLQQRIAPLTPVPWIVEARAPTGDEALLAYLHERAKTPFVLEQGPLLRIHVIARSPDDHVVLFVVHHLVFDGVSLGALLRTLFAAYDRLRRGEPLIPAVLAAGYRDFVQWERSMLDSESGRAHRAYWQQQLAGNLPVLELPTDHPRAAHANVAGRTYARTLSSEQTQRIRAASAELSVSVSVLLLGAFELLLHRYTGETDVIVGVTTAGRPQPRFEGLIGHFVNMIALRHRIAGGEAFAAWARSLQLTLVEGLDHADYPFSRIVNDLRAERREPRSTIFQVAYTYQNASLWGPDGLRASAPDGLAFEPVDGLHQAGEYELVLEVVERPADLVISFCYDAALYSETTIARMADHYLNILLQVLDQPGLPLSAYAPMTVAESQQMLEGWNATAAPYPHDRGLTELIAEQVLRTPHATAAVFEGDRVTYRELDERSDQLALRLGREGVRAGDCVGLCVERSLDIPIGLLGILKAGAAYVPLDPTYPRERLTYMQKDSGARIVVTQSRLLHLFADPAFSVKTVCLDDDLGGHRAQDKAALPAPPRGDALVNVLYTSGSTGQPKGVMNSHRGMVNILFAATREPWLAARDRILAVANYNFDIAGVDMFLPLLVGAECHICTTEKARDPKLLVQEIARVRPTMMQATPTRWTTLVQAGWQNREGVKILTLGETLPQALRQHFVHSGWQAWNVYGPTEVSIWCVHEKITATEVNTIGKPIANTQIYILDAYQQPAPVLVPGEICIGGDGVGVGYLNRPALTAEKFVANPFRPGSKMYRSGDVARWRPDGTIEIIGRSDGQVKVRGHRVELGEIEARLATHPGILESAVVVYERDGHKQLAACCALAGGSAAMDLTSSATVRALREYLQATLPDYMVPSRFVEVPSLPLSPNGKVDRKRLAQIATAAQTTVDEVAPASAASSTAPAIAQPSEQEVDPDIAERLRRIWRGALPVSDVGFDDGFFDLGGDSVMAVTMAARIEREFGRAFGATAMFRFGTIRQIALHLQSLQAAGAARAPDGASKAPGPAAGAPDVSSYDRDCVAIIGISCRLPGANDHWQFWGNLIHGVESIQRLSPEALARAGVPASMLADPNYVPVQAAIDGKQFFDAEFFKASPRDAELMDPQLRLLLQHGWQAVEDAGYAARAIPETGVWIATSHSDYAARVHGARGSAAKGVLASMDEHAPWLFAQSGTIPTLISHRLGFQGPSQAVHSNCSSSLVAVHAAHRSLIAGEVKYALVGAATIFANDSLGHVHQPGLPLSSDGHVRAFDAAANGTVGGEGVAVVLLKRAADAIADGDHIYALIRGVAVNNDGTDKAGFHAPSVEGQTDVIVKALHAANVDPRSISYVEAHGTGTPLGDPIELQAISAAYRRYTADTQFCGIGSVKTNIGHVDTAAGLAGLIKVALSLEHRELPPTLHYRQPNPRFALRESPFFVVDQRTPWDQQAGARRAAVSAFGLGGTNAHAILEEAPAARRDGTGAAGDRPALIVLSARTAEQLRERAEQLLAHASSIADELFDIAYTLQVGREAMEHRLAFAATSVEMMRTTLRAFVAGDSDGVHGVYRGAARKDKEMWGALIGDAEFAETIDKWLQRGKYKRLLELWSKGVPVDWSKLYAAGGAYAQTRPRRISLPGYPFAKQRYWIEAAPVSANVEVGGVLHPLVQRNTSDLEGQRFSSTFDGTEFYLDDHRVNGRKVLPAVCYLEMARVALERSVAPSDLDHTVVILKDVVWMRPVIVDGMTDVHVRLREREDGEVEFEVYSDAETLHAQGRALLADTGAVTSEERLDLEALRARCQGAIDGALLYSTFRAAGADYGPAYQGLARVHTGVDANGQSFALAQVTLPACVNDTRDRYVLHPSILDCALQATFGLSLSDASSARPSMPFALKQLEILDRSPSVAWVVARWSHGELNVKICDEQGQVCVRVQGFSRRAIVGELETQAATRMIHLSPRWEAQPLPETVWPDAASRVVLVGGSPLQQQVWRRRYAQLQTLQFEADPSVGRIADALAACAGVDHVVWLAPASAPGSVADEALVEDQRAGVIGLYRLIKALLRLGYGARPLGLTAVTWQCQAVERSEPLDPTHAGVHGLIGSLAKEYEGWKVRLVDGPPTDEAFVDDLLRVPADPNGDAWVYRGGEWYRQRLIAYEPEGSPEAPYRQGGVYVVIGGAGGIGEAFSEHVIRSHGARVVWLGRSAMSAAIEAKIARLARLGPAPLYIACDAADRAGLEEAYRRIKAQYGQIHGVVHSAVALLDKSLAQMEEDRFRAGLAAKVDVSVRLAQVFAREALDFVVFFSALTSFLKPAGQSNYAAGCTFADAFASRLALEWPSAVNVMNWGYWGSVGGAASESYRTRMARLGFGSIEPAEGMAALGRLLGGPLSQTAFLKTVNPQAFASPARRAPVAKQGVASEVRSAAASGRGDTARLRERVIVALKARIGEAIKMSPDQIDEHGPLEEYGMDSLLVVKLTNGMKEFFSGLSSTLFFDHRTIASVADYLVRSEESGAARWVGDPAATIAEPAKAVEPAVRATRSRGRRAAAPARAPAPTNEAATNSAAGRGIAIIGMSARYPDARNVDEYWDNLKAGRNCIHEIPAGRWDHGRYFDPQPGKPGKCYSKWGGFIEDVDKFDPLFFRISPQEAEELDPQERLFLQEAYASIEDAGYTPAGLCASRNVGVYVGVMNSTYRLYSTYWSIANRVSYVLDLQGPSMAVDTACSSSLTALHLAVESLLSGGCEVAIAGGVALIVDPIQYTSLSAMTMLSAGDRCRAFGAQADGMIAGEGVGAIVLKPLDRAIQDGDHIYGVIRGSAVNAGGKTNGYTVPNPTAQRELIQRALRTANIDPRTISYLEAHGTGTELGDPIEIAGLTQAFSAWPVAPVANGDPPYCAIGSVKSNIGHTASAAGIAGIIKVLLQMRHRTLVPSLHSEVLNPHIDFSRTPFRVQQSVSEWRRPVLSIDGQQREFPRLAGISSFGAGGGNAHVIIEEYEAPAAATASQRPALIVLSAKTEEQLQDRARRLLSRVSGLANDELAAIAYTLQVGREAMECRLAFTAATLDELRDRLSGYLAGRLEDLQVGRARREHELAQLATDEAVQAAAEEWIRSGQYTQLLGSWVKGLRVAWTELYAGGSTTGWSRPGRVSLPTYPFARERCWKGIEGPVARDAAERTMERALHPLLQRNTSNLNEVRFSTTLRGDAFVVADHVIAGQPLLPGVAYLEMARAAVAVSLDLDAAASPVIELRDVVWIRPLSVGDPQDVHIRLHALEGDEIEYEIYTGTSALAGEDAIHAGGRAVRPTEVEWATPIDIDRLRAQCDRSLDAAECYAAFATMGMAYGPAYRGLVSVQAGVDASGPFVLAQVKLPDCVSETRDAYVLHPSVLDSALQAGVGLVLFDGGDASLARPGLPFTLERLQLLNRSPQRGWVVMRPSAAVESRIQKLDIDICEESGHVCVRMRGFTSRVVDRAEAPASVQPASVQPASVLLEPTWEAKPILSRGPDRSGASGASGERWILLAGAYQHHLDDLKSRDPSVHVVGLPEAHGADGWLAASEQVFDCVRSILRAGPSRDVVVQVVVADEPGSELGAALAGLLKSANHENPKLIGQLIILPHTATTGELAHALHDNAGAAALRDPEVRYTGGARHTLSWTELPAGHQQSSPWRDGGVYLITGGAGGLGMIFAREIIGKARGAKVILTGRSSLDAARRAQVEDLPGAAPGSHVEYRVLDVTDAAAVEACVADILRRHGALHGILHAAGVLRDSFILKKEVDELRAVWAPKVVGALNLDRATKDIALDAFILFSSLSGVFGNLGQSDYALANAAMDRYARARDRQVEANERSGRTLSINWPHWERGGMGTYAARHEELRQMGLGSLTTAAGLDAFYRAWARGVPQVMVVAGDRQKLGLLHAAARTSVAAVPQPAARPAPQAPATHDDALRAATIDYVKRHVSAALKLSVERIAPGVGLDQYGVDSILALKVVRELEAIFGSLPKTLLFEHQSVEALAAYLIKTHRATLVSHLMPAATPVAAPAPRAPAPSPAPRAVPRLARRATERLATGPRATESRDIAVIGLAGRYPGAEDIHELWENLRAGKDCVTEVPPHRWDHGKYYDAEKGKPGKTTCKWGGFIRGTDTFDHAFFRLSAQDAQRMDPQERILLEVIWHLMEDAGYTSHHLRTRHQRGVGVYVGGHSLVEAGASTAYTASRITEFLGLRGPSFVVDTLSASSATALHLACQGLLAGDCQLAIAAGICVLHPQVMVASDSWLTSREDRRGFSTEGGFIFSEGAGAVLLKPLRDAMRDSDRILAVIKATALDSSGRAKRQFPSDPVVMANVIRSSLEKARVAARTIGCVELAVAGAAANDYTEVSAYTTVFRETTADAGFCAMGTVESNLGHCVASSGIAQLTKAIFQLRHGETVPTIKMDPVNPELDIERSPFFLPRSRAPWPRPSEGSRELPRRALVTSRGADGTQVAIVLEEHPPAAERSRGVEGAQDRLFLLSAPSPDRLRAVADALRTHLVKHPASDLGDLAYTLNRRREEMQHRLAVIAATTDELSARLAEYVDGTGSGTRSPGRPRVAVGDAMAGRVSIRELLDEQAEARLLREYVADNALEKLARYWVSGSDVRGAGFGDDPAARIAALPLYPFASSRVAPARGGGHADVHGEEGRGRATNGLASAKEPDLAQEQG